MTVSEQFKEVTSEVRHPPSLEEGGAGLDGRYLAENRFSDVARTCYSSENSRTVLLGVGCFSVTKIRFFVPRTCDSMMEQIFGLIKLIDFNITLTSLTVVVG